MKGLHLLKSLIEVSQQYVWCGLGKSQLSLYGTPEVQFFYCPDKITFPSSPKACLSSPAHITLTTFQLNRDLSWEQPSGTAFQLRAQNRARHKRGLGRLNAQIPLGRTNLGALRPLPDLPGLPPSLLRLSQGFPKSLG